MSTNANYSVSGRSITLHNVPAGYPHTDAREWAAYIAPIRWAARALAAETGRTVEVYDESGSMIDAIEADPPERGA